MRDKSYRNNRASGSGETPGETPAPKGSEKSLDPKGSGETSAPKGSDVGKSVRGLLKTGPSSKPKPGDSASTEKAKGAEKAGGAEKAARFLMVVGRDEAAEILRHLDETDVEAIAREIARIGTLTGSDAEDILREVGVAAESLGDRHGGPAVAKEFLTRAFGTEQAEDVYARLNIEGASRFSFLEELEPQQVTLLLKEESAPVVATILSTLNAAPAARILKLMSEDRRAEVVLRMARMNAVSPNVLERVEEVLKERIRQQGKLVSEDIDGRGVLASILRHMEFDSERAVLESLEEEDPELAKSIRDRLFTIDSILAIEDRDLQHTLNEFTEREVACVLVGQAERVRTKILRNVSERRAREISEEYVHQGDIPDKEISEVRKRFLDHLRRLVEDGSILVRDSQDEYI